MEKSLLDDCIKVTEKILKNKNAIPFSEPVDPEAHNCPDYFDIIKNPMDIQTILTKLKENQYDSFDSYVDDMNLVFSNCMLYNKGSKGKVLRNCCTYVSSMFDKLLQGIMKRHKALFVDEKVKMKWAQCDICLKWRFVSANESSIPRWKCKDSGLSCETPQEDYPKSKGGYDYNLVTANIISINESSAKRKFVLPENTVSLIQNDVLVQNFRSFLLSCWACLSTVNSSIHEIAAKFDTHLVEPYILYKCAKEYKYKWEKVREELATTRSVLSSTNKTEVLKQLYMEYIKPFEKKWEKSCKSPVPSTSDIFRSKKPKLSPSTCHVCNKELGKNESLSCIICHLKCCKTCYNGKELQEKAFVCMRCQLATTASWDRYPVCLVCGREIINPEENYSLLCCCKCKGLVHSSCNNDIVNNKDTWECADCNRNPQVLTSYMINPSSQLLLPSVRSIK